MGFPYGQGIFQKYLVTDGDIAEGERIGGFGSTILRPMINDGRIVRPRLPWKEKKEETEKNIAKNGVATDEK